MRSIWTPEVELPRLLERDERLWAAREAIEPQLALLSKAALECLHLPRLRELPEPVLDLLANQYHADFYEPIGMDTDTKIALIEDALHWHFRKGTASAVEEIARKVYRLAEVSEWFEYGGEPYFFRIMQDITSDDEPVDAITLDRLRLAVNASKNARSWLEFFGFMLTSDEAIAPTDKGVLLNLLLDRKDEYDFRRGLAAHDGIADYGAANVFDGALDFGGGNDFGGGVSRWDYGRRQAADFEQHFLSIDLSVRQTVSAVEGSALSISMAPTADTLRATDADEEVKIGLYHQDYDPEFRDGGSKFLFGLDRKETIGSIDEGSEVRMTQQLSFGGDLSFDGASTYAGELSAVQAGADDAWQALYGWLREEFEERCPSCGSTVYRWHKSSARLGGDKFLISDPQFPTVRIECGLCGALIAEYLVDDENLEVRVW